MKSRLGKIGFLAASLLGILLRAPTAEAQTAACESPNVLVVLDRSGSMSSDISGKAKWDWAKEILLGAGGQQGIIAAHQIKIRFGLMAFPADNDCGTGRVQVDIADRPLDQFTAVLTSAAEGPRGMTPLADALRAANNYPGLRDPNRRNFVLLISDGDDTCASNDNAPIQSVVELAQNGIKTFVVGFGSGISTSGQQVMNQMADAGGFPLTGTTHYYKAEQPADLRTALDSIVREITTEICDGKDNDCDGRVDEGLTQPCDLGCGPGLSVCNNGVWEACNAPAPNACGQCNPPRESCNGRDDNCNGLVDEDVSDCSSSEVCVCGRCSRACDADGRCSNLGEFCVNGRCVVDPCCGVQCAAGQRCQGGRCTDPCASVTCSTGQVCQQGQCVAADCNAPGNECPSGKVCRAGVCADDPCASVTCGNGEFCRDGQCVGSCRAVVCGATQVCVDGRCEESSCHTTCPSGQICNAQTGLCAADACYARRDACPRGKVCKLGACVDDPCTGIRCPGDATCRGGQCVDAPSTPPQPTADAGEAAGGDDAGTGPTSPPVDPVNQPGGAPPQGGGGGSCDLGLSGSSTSSLVTLAGIAVCAGALALRRRRRALPND